MDKTVLKTRKYKVGYEIRTELWRLHPDEKPTEIKAAYTPDGHYIGRSKDAHFLCKKRGIKPEKADLNHCVCSIGFCEKEQKWYGWSHRALCGFGMGDKLFEEKFTDDGSVPYVKHGDFTIENMCQAKQAAVNFASSVS
jgi:hypothetical protein